MDTQAGAQFATKSHQTTIDLQAGIIASQKNEIDRLNILAVDNAAEIESIKQTVKWYQGEAGKRKGEAARAGMAAAPAQGAGGLLFDDRMVYAAMSVEGHARTSSENVRDVLEAVTRVVHSAAPAAPSEQAHEYKEKVRAAIVDLFQRMEKSYAAEPTRRITFMDIDAVFGHVAALGLGGCLDAAAAPAAPLPGQPEQWKGLNDVQWMNIVNHDQAFDLYDKNDAVHAAVKMTEAKLKEINASDGAAPLPELTGSSESQILAARAEGRAEALQIVIGLDAEDALGKYTGYSRSGAPEDEGSAHWEVEKLRELFGTDDKLLNLFDRAEGMYWEASGKSDDADRMMIMVRQAPYFKPLHDFLSQHEAWGLMADLQRANESTPAASPSPAPAPADTKGGMDIDDVIAELGIADEVAAIRSERLDAPARTREPQNGLVPPLVAAPVSQHETIAGAVARGWCSPENESKVMNTDLALAITREVETMLASRCRAQGGDTKTSDAEFSPASRMGGITSKESGETAQPTETKRIEITINGRQLRDALEAAWTDRSDPDEGDTELTLFVRDKAEVSAEGETMERGLWFYWADYPEEGVCYLDPNAPETSVSESAETAAPGASQSIQGEQQ